METKILLRIEKKKGNNFMKKIVYVDMDDTIVDFQSGIDRLSSEDLKKYENEYDNHPYIFSLMKPKEGAIESLYSLDSLFHLYILSTAPWDNPNAWKQKREWVERYFGKGKENLFHKKVILSHHKDLNEGDFLIDDRKENGAEDFKGEWIHFGTDKFPDWDAVTDYLEGKV